MFAQRECIDGTLPNCSFWLDQVHRCHPLKAIMHTALGLGKTDINSASGYCLELQVVTLRV